MLHTIEFLYTIMQTDKFHNHDLDQNNQGHHFPNAFKIFEWVASVDDCKLLTEW